MQTAVTMEDREAGEQPPAAEASPQTLMQRRPPSEGVSHPLPLLFPWLMLKAFIYFLPYMIRKGLHVCVCSWCSPKYS